MQQINVVAEFTSASRAGTSPSPTVFSIVKEGISSRLEVGAAHLWLPVPIYRDEAISGGELLRYTQDDILDEIVTPSARNDIGRTDCSNVRDYRTFPLASEAKIPPKQRMAKIMKDIFMLSWKSG